MNERIQELINQSMVEHQFEIRFSPEKFAELLIAECVKIVEELPPGYIDYRNQIEDAFRRDCIAKIQERFGVEE